MKKIFYVLFAPLLFTLFSCSDVIFDDIRQEVKLEDPDVAGSINSIVYFSDDIYLQNGNIWKKSVANTKAHGWIKVGKPDASAEIKYVNKLASDSTYLYAQVTLVEIDTDEEEHVSKGCQIYCTTDGIEWKGPLSVSVGEKNVTTFGSGKCKLFCTNAPVSENRKAYINYNSVVYKLDGISAQALTTVKEAGNKLSDYDNKTIPTYASKYCAYFNNNVYFSSNVMTTNESVSEPATCIYYADGDVVHWSLDGEFESDNKIDFDYSKICSLSVTKDYIYFGTSKGIKHVAFEKNADGTYSSIPGKKFAEGLKNAESTLSASYNVNTVLAMNADKLEKDNVIYGTTDFSGSTSSSSAVQENKGLWAYIPTRKSWNRE